jgi:two-component system cell cycle response regulator
MLRGCFRQSDTVGRYGGEEFVVILPEASAEAAQLKLESFRELVASTPVYSSARGDLLKVTVSIGSATFPDDGEDPAELFALADDRMFQAKRNGRNQVVPGPGVAKYS